MGSPPGQHLEDTHLALVSCPPPRCSVQGSKQVGSAAQKNIVEVDDPLLGRAGQGRGPLDPALSVWHALCTHPRFLSLPSAQLL